MSTTATVCLRCGEGLVDPDRPCGLCREERIREAVELLCAAAKSSGKAALSTRVDAIDTLRSLGFTQEQVIHARARALDRHSVDEIVAELTNPSNQTVAA